MQNEAREMRLSFTLKVLNATCGFEQGREMIMSVQSCKYGIQILALQVG